MGIKTAVLVHDNIVHKISHCRKIRKVNLRHGCIFLILLLSFSLPILNQTVHASGSQWALSLQVEKNGQVVSDSAFAPFDLISLAANVSYNNSTQPNVLVSFKIQDPANSMNITRTETTDSNGQAQLIFHLPISNPNNGSVTGTWQASATIQTSDGPIKQNLSFTTHWNMEISSITLQDSQGKNQTTFSAGNTVTIMLSINNNYQALPANVTINMQNSLGNMINQTQIQNNFLYC